MDTGLHVVMLPWLAFGHVMPFLQLSKSLAELGIQISFISTPRNIERLPKIPPNLAARINLVKLPLPRVDNLPENAEATMDLPLDKVQYLKKAYDLLQYPFERFLAKESPDWVIYDFVPHWAPEIAARLGVKSVLFSVCFAAALAFIGPPVALTGDSRLEKRSSPETMLYSPDWIPFPSAIALHRHEVDSLFLGFCSEDVTGVSSGDRVAHAIRACPVVAVRSCMELEGEYFDLLEELYGKPVIPVGLLTHQPAREVEIDVDSDWFKGFNWLGKRAPMSVVFVGFGSECRLSRDQVFELAFGLVQSKLPFVWALRRPPGAIDDVGILPEGFEDRVSDQGIVCMGWCPQGEILAHPAIGGCLFHSGWGSVIECLQYGHTLVVLPLMYDQPLNARSVVEKELGVEVEINEVGSFTRDGVSRALRHAMVEERGEKVRMNARKMKTLILEWELHRDYVGRFAGYLNGYKNSSRNRRC